MRVRFLPAARDYATQAGDRLEREYKGYGRRFAAELRKAESAIGSAPSMQIPVEDGPDDLEVREYFLAVFNYRVIFTILDSEAVVVAVIHAARPPGLWLPRLSHHP